MVKVKHERTADCVVAGFRWHKDGEGVGSLLLGLYDADGTLHHVGVARRRGSEQFHRRPPQRAGRRTGAAAGERPGKPPVAGLGGRGGAGRGGLITAQWWKEERGRRVFLDYNQNAPHRTVFGAWCVRPKVGAQVSTPIAWAELDTVVPDDLTIATVPGRVAGLGDPWADRTPQSIEPLLEMSQRDMAAGLMDAPWPPVYPKMPDEPPRVQPSRARKD
jgi:hypothetical protein